jgi:hypothetical protein
LCRNRFARAAAALRNLVGELDRQPTAQLDAVLEPLEDRQLSVLAWLRSPSGIPNPRSVHRQSVQQSQARRGELPDAIIAAGELKITPLTNTVPEEATALTRQAYALLPHVKITDLLLEVDRWTGFSRHFTHPKTGQPCEDRTLLLTAMLADAINLGIAKMAEACPGTTAPSSTG